jgi:protein O-GlcNAc transferase
MTKIISFSLWGDNPKYCIGAIKNAQLAQIIYPDWECWFYYPANNSPSVISILEMMPNVKVKPVSQPGDCRSTLWRFEAAADLNCEVMISRDCDSRLSLRERAAVDEWLASDKVIHVMRDHPYHSVPILAGMWGAKRGALPNLKQDIIEFLKNGLRDDGNYWQVDQDFLANYVWTHHTRHIMIHDDGFWTQLWGGRPFPIPRSGLEFIGQVFDENDITIAEHQTILERSLK